MDWLGDVGGVIETLSRSAVFLLGSYLTFNSTLQIIHDIYLQDHHHHHDDNDSKINNAHYDLSKS